MGGDEGIKNMKLVTHLNPHLDDIAAIWLFKKFFPDFVGAEVEFIPYSKDRALTEETPEKIFLGTGGGKYDEHKGDLEDCAASLVWKDIKVNGIGPKDSVELAALEELVEWVRIIDLGRFPDLPYGEFNVQAFIRTEENTADLSIKSTKLGEEILDRVLRVLMRKYQAITDWEGRVEFTSRFGKSYAVKSDFVDRSFCRGKDGNLYLIYEPGNNSIQFFTPSMEIDLEPVYKKLQEEDRGADWFLHQSHHMVLCTSQVPAERRSKLSFERLIKVAKEA